jgi:exodeoxyribonuclease-1
MDPASFATLKPAFSDPRLDELFLRFEARHYPEALSQRELDKWEEYRFRKLITGDAGSRTVSMVREAVARCREALSGAARPGDHAQSGILDDVLAYTNSLAAVIDPFGTVAPAPGPALAAPVDGMATANPGTAPVQPDLFGGPDVTPATRRVRTRRP